MRVFDIDDRELNFDDLKQTWKLLWENWDDVQEEAECLIAEAKRQGYAAVWERVAFARGPHRPPAANALDRSACGGKSK